MEKLLDYVFYVLLDYDYSVKCLSNDATGIRQWFVKVENRISFVLDEHDIAALKFIREHLVEDQKSIDRYDKFFLQLTED